MAKLSYWVASSDSETVRGTTRKAVKGQIEGREGLEKPHKVTVEFANAYDLATMALTGRIDESAPVVEESEAPADEPAASDAN